MHNMSMPHYKIYEILLSLDNSVAIFIFFWSGQNRKMMGTSMCILKYSYYVYANLYVKDLSRLRIYNNNETWVQFTHQYLPHLQPKTLRNVCLHPYMIFNFYIFYLTWDLDSLRFSIIIKGECLLAFSFLFHFIYFGITLLLHGFVK